MLLINGGTSLRLVLTLDNILTEKVAYFFIGACRYTVITTAVCLRLSSAPALIDRVSCSGTEG